MTTAVAPSFSLRFANTPPAETSSSSLLICFLLHAHVNLEWCDKIKLSNLLLTEEWRCQKPTTDINFGNSLGPGTTRFQDDSRGAKLQFAFREHAP